MSKSVEKFIQQQLAIAGDTMTKDFLDCVSSLGLLVVKGEKSMRKASQLSEMIHSNKHGLSSVQEYLNEHPITAFELLNLIGIERAKGESELESAIKSKAASKKKDQIWKREIVKPEWEKWQKEPDLYKSKADFARKMLKLEDCPLDNENLKKATDTISVWCRNWKRGDNRSKPTYDDLKEEREMRLELDSLIKKNTL